MNIDIANRFDGRAVEVIHDEIWRDVIRVIAPLVPELVPFHTLETVFPLASVRWAVQPLKVAGPVLATVTSPWKPPGHVFTMRNVAVQAPVGAVAGGVVGGVLVVAALSCSAANCRR